MFKQPKKGNWEQYIKNNPLAEWVEDRVARAHGIGRPRPVTDQEISELIDQTKKLQALIVEVLERLKGRSAEGRKIEISEFDSQEAALEGEMRQYLKEHGLTQEQIDTLVEGARKRGGGLGG